MIGKQNIWIRTYIIGIFFLLGLFGIGGNSVFAQGLVAKCTAENTPNDGNTHQYTCEYKTNEATLCKKDNSTSTWFDSIPGCNWGTVCHRCIPTSAPAIVAKPTETNIQTPAKPIDAKAACESQIPKAQWNSSKWATWACELCSDPWVCCGIKLNTNVPFVGKCIRLGTDPSSTDTTVVTEVTAFPVLMWALTKIMTTFILLICFGGILVGGVMVASSGWETARASEGKKLIGKIVMAMALLWASGIILHLINPNFFW